MLPETELNSKLSFNACLSFVTPVDFRNTTSSALIAILTAFNLRPVIHQVWMRVWAQCQTCCAISEESIYLWGCFLLVFSYHTCKATINCFKNVPISCNTCSEHSPDSHDKVRKLHRGCSFITPATPPPRLYMSQYLLSSKMNCNSLRKRSKLGAFMYYTGKRSHSV